MPDYVRHLLLIRPKAATESVGQVSNLSYKLACTVPGTTFNLERRRQDLSVLAVRQAAQDFQVDLNPNRVHAAVAEYELADRRMPTAEVFTTAAERGAIRIVLSRFRQWFDRAAAADMVEQVIAVVERAVAGPGTQLPEQKCFSPTKMVLVRPSVMMAKSTSESHVSLPSTILPPACTITPVAPVATSIVKIISSPKLPA